MKFLVIYDIASNSVRLKISNYCKDYGLKRIQKSSFSGEITPNRAEMLAIKCRATELSEGDCVFFLPCCDSCFGRKIIIGSLDERTLEKPELVIVG